MVVVFTLIVFAFVLSVLAVVGYALFEISPFATHRDHFRDPRTGERVGESPRLDWTDRELPPRTRPATG
jgi:hypothetical protein